MSWCFFLATLGYRPSMSGSFKYFLDYFWSELAVQTFAYIVSSCEKGHDSHGSDAYCCIVLNSCYKWYDVKPVYLIAFFSCAL